MGPVRDSGQSHYGGHVLLGHGRHSRHLRSVENVRGGKPLCHAISAPRCELQLWVNLEITYLVDALLIMLIMFGNMYATLIMSPSTRRLLTTL